MVKVKVTKAVTIPVQEMYEFPAHHEFLTALRNALTVTDRFIIIYYYT